MTEGGTIRGVQASNIHHTQFWIFCFSAGVHCQLVAMWLLQLQAADLKLGIYVDLDIKKQAHNIRVTVLQSDGQRSQPVLCNRRVKILCIARYIMASAYECPMT